jgi:hypothetical protein
VVAQANITPDWKSFYDVVHDSNALKKRFADALCLVSLTLCKSQSCAYIHQANENRYWSRRFRKHMANKRSGRMTTIPQLGPEVFVDGVDDENEMNKQARATVSPFLSPMEISDPRSSFITHGLDGAARLRSGSVGAGPASPASPGIALGILRSYHRIGQPILLSVLKVSRLVLPARHIVADVGVQSTPKTFSKSSTTRLGVRVSGAVSQ